MSGLAKYLLENGCDVSGSDIVDSKYIDKLRKLGAKVYIGQKKKMFRLMQLLLLVQRLEKLIRKWLELENWD